MPLQAAFLRGCLELGSVRNWNTVTKLAAALRAA